MSKKPANGIYTPGDHRDSISESMESFACHRVECWACGLVDFKSETTKKIFARQLYDSGWRHIVSRKYNLAGVACPKCVATTDSHRGCPKDNDK